MQRIIKERPRIEVFTTLLGAKIMAEGCRHDYNYKRLDSSLGYMAPREFQQNWQHNKQDLTTVLAHYPRAGHSP